MRMLALVVAVSISAAPATAQQTQPIGRGGNGGMGGTGGTGGSAAGTARIGAASNSVGAVSNTTSIQGPSGGTYTVRNTPSLGQSIAIGPCVVGVGAQTVGAGFGVGVNFGKEDYACTVRGNTALLAQMGYTQEALTYFAQEVPQIAQAFATVQQVRAATPRPVIAPMTTPSYCHPLANESVRDRLMRERNCLDAAAEVGQQTRAFAGGQHWPAAAQLRRLASGETWNKVTPASKKAAHRRDRVARIGRQTR